MKTAYRLLIGSIGDDSHSVGTTLLTITFREAGFIVENIGISNSLEDFFTRARHFNAVLISCMNGHSELFLKGFEQKKQAFELSHNDPVAWCLGGNLSVKDDEETVESQYRQIGFDFVAPKPISAETVCQNLHRIFTRKGIHEKPVYSQLETTFPTSVDWKSVNDTPLTDAEFEQARHEVLSSWHTGPQVLDANISRNHADRSKNLHHVILRNRTRRSPLIQPRTGVAHVDDQINLLQFLYANGLEISSIQLDAASRKKMFKQAQEGVEKTTEGGSSFLNGYPVVTHGVKGIERILDAIETPFQIRAGSPDHRLAYEIGLAGGASSIEGGFICYLYPYDKLTSPVECLQYWKYVDKLAERYYRLHKVVINREYFGPLTCCLIEPVVPICINITQAILSAKSGVRSVSVAVAEQGNRAQDIAAIRVLGKMTRLYLQKYGLRNCSVSTVFHQYMAAFPSDLEKAKQLIVESTVTGVLSGADRIMTKSHVESKQIPPREANAIGLQLTCEGVKQARGAVVDWERVAQEEWLLEQEVRGIMGWIEEAGGGSLAKGIMSAFEQGVLDIQFSPSTYNRNRLFSARDEDGAIRFVNPEKLPFPEPVIDFHLEKMDKRMVSERTNKLSEILERDLTRIWKNEYLQWPLDGHCQATDTPSVLGF